MTAAEINQHPIQVLFNYWEIRPTLMGAKLDEFLRQGVSHIATFVPWQAVESDISHTLVRFLQAVADRKMTVNLIVTPEVGVHYPYSGIPKDVITRSESQGNLAMHAGSGTLPVTLPPNGFQLPSLFSAEFTKRYYGFLSRLDGMLADLGKNSPTLLKGVNLVLTGSFWKYYRSPQASSKNAFAGQAGDFSSSASLEYRQRTEQFFAQREFSDPTPMAANRWKTRQLESVNRRWFQKQSEDVFRNRTFQLVRRKAASVGVIETELYTPEADPALAYSNLLMMLSGGHGDFAKISSMVDEAAARASCGSMGPARAMIHWTSLGGFRGLADPEKQFLILKSLLLMGGQGGGVLIDESEWFSLSTSFRARVESFAKSLAHQDLRLKTRALYLAPHLWSGAGTLWNELFQRVGTGARMISSLDMLASKRDASAVRERVVNGLDSANEASLLIVDPSWILTQESVRKLTAWASGGRVVVLPRSPLYTEMARAELELIAAQTKRIEIDLGVPYRLHAIGDGKLIIYDLPETESFIANGESLSSWQTFLTAVLSVAEVQGYCRLSDSRLSVLPLERKDRGLGLFVLNSTRRPVAADILFQDEVSVSDLALALASAEQRGAAKRNQSTPANRFSLDVPPCGILPLAVDGLEMHEDRLGARERRLAADTADQTRVSAEGAALSELPGYDSTSNMEGLWS